ncbi:MAG TPA: glycosyltransferase family 2 protein [bacterium]|nr:glycosyltransferase family 2 protein [bacterium]
MKPYLSLVIPARNEEENLGETVRQLKPYLKDIPVEIIVVDDHSSDATAETARKLSLEFPALRLVSNQNQPGFASALAAGWKEARGEYVLPVMADGCDDPATIPLMVRKAREGYDLICGCRYCHGGGRFGGPKVQGFFSWWVGRSLHLLAGLPTADISNAYKMYRRQVLIGLKLREKGFAVSMEAALKFIFAGYRVADVPTIWYGRKKGKSKFRLSRTWPYLKLYWKALTRAGCRLLR